MHFLESSPLKGKVKTDSAGTHGYHIGEAPDPRSIAAAKKRDIDLSTLRARKVAPDDFHQFDLILACDNQHLSDLKQIAPDGSKAKIALYLPYVGMRPDDLADPYYGSHRDFEYVLDTVQAASQRLLQQLMKDLG